MKKIVFVALVIAMVFAMTGSAFATLVVQVGPCPGEAAGVVPQSVAKELPVTIYIAPTMQMDTFDLKTKLQLDQLDFGCGNPFDDSEVTASFKWTIKSNLPFWKRISMSTLPETDYELESPLPDPDTGKPGEIGIQPINDKLHEDQFNAVIDGDTENPHVLPWWSGIVGKGTTADTHEDNENVDLTYDIQWCDSAGVYTGAVLLEAFQN